MTIRVFRYFFTQFTTEFDDFLWQALSIDRSVLSWFVLSPKLWLKSGEETSAEDCRDYLIDGVQERDDPLCHETLIFGNIL